MPKRAVPKRAVPKRAVPKRAVPKRAVLKRAVPSGNHRTVAPARRAAVVACIGVIEGA
ncbi:hypothetical protein Aph02nite_02650 [Actinoplanes philippinensis]|nr:hypothetical protein Aph02nite_02650 [Actinoplanes philippinensis]